VCAGVNIAGPFYALDTTRAEVIDWLIALIRKVRRWGYDYLKLDFLYAAALPGSRQAAPGRETSYRQALALLRQEAGDAYVLGCGAPVIPSLGLCDGLRVGPDVAPYWINRPYTQGNSNLTAPGAQNALRTSLHRLWLKPLLHVDPDAVYFRTRPMWLNAAQRRLLQDLGQLCGFKSTSDLPAWLRADEREQLRQFLLAAPAAEQTGRYQFRLAEHQVDFSDAIAQPSLGSRLPLGLVMQLGLLQDALQAGLPALLAARQARRQERRK
jgi:alpha-galactosidase